MMQKFLIFFIARAMLDNDAKIIQIMEFATNWLS